MSIMSLEKAKEIRNFNFERIVESEMKELEERINYAFEQSNYSFLSFDITDYHITSIKKTIGILNELGYKAECGSDSLEITYYDNEE